MKRTGSPFETLQKGHMQPVVTYDPFCGFFLAKGGENKCGLKLK